MRQHRQHATRFAGTGLRVWAFAVAGLYSVAALHGLVAHHGHEDSHHPEVQCGLCLLTHALVVLAGCVTLSLAAASAVMPPMPALTGFARPAAYVLPLRRAPPAQSKSAPESLENPFYRIGF